MSRGEGNYLLAFPSNYLRGADLQGREVAVTIARVDLEHEVIQRDEQGKSTPAQKLCIWFDGKSKGLILNKTNARSIARKHGSEISKWVGKQITLYPKHGKWFGAEQDAVRVK